MKKSIVLIMVLFCVSMFFMTTGGKKKPAPEKPKLRVGVECDYVPNSWTENSPSEHNHPIANFEGSYADGYDIQIAKLVANKLDYVLEVKKIAWNDLLPSLNKGDIDAIFSSMLDTQERRNIAAFSDPYEVSRAEYGIIVDSVSPYITAKKLGDFRGAKMLGEKGTKLDEVIAQIPGAVHMKPANTIQDMVEAVANGEADGAVIDTDTGSFYEIMNKNLTLIKFSPGDGFNLGYHGVCAGVRKDDGELLHKINIAIAGIDRSERKRIMDSVNTRMVKNLR